MRVAIVEPYFGGSHAAWASGYEQHSQHDVVVISHTDRFWKWRMHGAHVTLAESFAAEVQAKGPFDVIFGSSMLNLAGFLGLARRSLNGARVVVYMHENQLGYPLSPRDKLDLTYPMINWTSMVGADAVLFNSDYHRDQWFGEIPRFLRQFPDYQQHHLIAEVQERSSVLPVGIDLGRFDGPVRAKNPVARIVWNQRWEYDKGPAELAAAITGLDERGDEFELVLAGEQFPTDPAEFLLLRDRLGDRLVHYGWADNDSYVELLSSSDIVVSTAHHEFFGISITEAIYAGAFPILPNRLVYPERIPARLHVDCLYTDEAELLERLVWATAHRKETAAIVEQLRSTMAVADWSVVAPQYDNLLTGIA
jgi:glycosyltransferase involved in cell wall biosynthesis